MSSFFSNRLIACAKLSNITSKFLWKGKIELTEEVLLILDSIQENYDEIDKVVASLHSYETYSLATIKIDLINFKTKSWLRESLEK